MVCNTIYSGSNPLVTSTEKQQTPEHQLFRGFLFLHLLECYSSLETLYYAIVDFLRHQKDIRQG